MRPKLSPSKSSSSPSSRYNYTRIAKFNLLIRVILSLATVSLMTFVGIWQQRLAAEISSSNNVVKNEIVDWLHNNNNNNNDNNINREDETKPFIRTVQKQKRQQEQQHLQSSLQFIDNNDLEQYDYFSATWLLNRERFLDIDSSKIGIVEDAVFIALGDAPNVYPYSKMSKDWTQFSVEHMSHWWKLFEVMIGDRNQLMEHFQSIFQKQVDKVADSIADTTTMITSTPTTALKETIAMIAFAPYPAAVDPTGEKGIKFTAHSLAATIAPLIRVGFGRIVIVGLNDNDMENIDPSCDILIDSFKKNDIRAEKITHDETVIAKIGDIEVSYVRVTDQRIYGTPFIPRNVPRAAVVLMQKAMNGKLDDSETEKWLGKNRDPAYWKYVYLTEPDTILQMKTELLPQFKQALDDGYSLFPHRLQALPHEMNLPAGHTVEPRFYLPSVGHFANVTELDTANGYSCCDGGSAWPGVKDFEDCGNFWYICGFNSEELKSAKAPLSEQLVMDLFKRFAVYPMMRLKDGTGVVFGATEHGRRCYPSRTSCS